VDDFESLSDDSDSQSLLTRVSSVEHKAIDESFDNRALNLSEFLDLVSSSSVGNKDLALSGGNSNIVLEADVINLDFSIIPLAEQFELASIVKLSFYTNEPSEIEKNGYRLGLECQSCLFRRPSVWK